MKKHFLLISILTLCIVLLSACGCRHEWTNTTCDTPKTCSLCGKTEGEALGHTWQNAGCSAPKTCTTCGETEGNALGHSWSEATCQSPRTCSVCAATEGDAIGHTFSNWLIDGDTMHRTCSVCAASESVPADHETILKTILVGRWNCTHVDYFGSKLPNYYVYQESTPYFEIKEDGQFHVYTVSTEFDGILKLKEYVSEEDGSGYYVFYCEVEGTPRVSFTLVPTPDDDPYIDAEDPYVIVSGGMNSLYFHAEPEGCEEVREALVGNWVSFEEYVNGKTIPATGYSLTFGNNQSFTLTTDTQLTGTWSLSGTSGYTIEFSSIVDKQFQFFAASLDLGSNGARCNINLGNDRHIYFKPASNE